MGLIVGDGRIAFIHIPKTAGWSVKTWLAHSFGETVPDVQELVRSQGFPIGHVRLADFEHFTGRPLDSFEKIVGVIRDPYERELSQWKFWWERRAQGGNHIHDAVAGHYNNLTDFVRDPRSQFHIWYRQHHEQPPVEQHLQYRDVGGFYRYWLDPFPDNLEIIQLETMSRDLPRLIQPYVDEPLRDIIRLNTSAVVDDPTNWYTGEACRIVNERYEWTWKSGRYQQWELFSQ